MGMKLAHIAVEAHTGTWPARVVHQVQVQLCLPRIAQRAMPMLYMGGGMVALVQPPLSGAAAFAEGGTWAVWALL
jgi:hypothetical protein